MTSKKFLDLEPKLSSPESSKFVILPVPFEATTSYGKGTANGPDAILKASKHLEAFDEELLREPCDEGIHTAKPLKELDEVREAVSDQLAAGKIPIILGGEHSITSYAVAACKNRFSELSVLQIDAHADLRDEYEGTKLSHACIVRRVLEICPAVQVGIRNISSEEYEFAKKTGQLEKIHFAHQMNENTIDKILSQLSDKVYVTIDTDGLDPSVIPSTGTPEPGGLSWYKLLEILRALAEKKEIVGFDLVEFSPIKGLHAPDFAAAKLVYKLIGYITSPDK